MATHLPTFANDTQRGWAYELNYWILDEYAGISNARNFSGNQNEVRPASPPLFSPLTL